MSWNMSALSLQKIIPPIFNRSNPATKYSADETRTTRMPAFWDTPCRPMITHTSDSHQIASQNKTKLQIKKIAKNWNFERNVTHDTTSEVSW